MGFWDWCGLLLLGMMVIDAIKATAKWFIDALIFKDAHAARAELKAVKAELQRLQDMLEAWNALQGAGGRARMKSHQSEYQPNGYWDTLGIKPTKDKAAIVSAFRKASMKAHPDRGGSAQAFQALFEARNAALREIGA